MTAGAHPPILGESLTPWGKTVTHTHTHTHKNTLQGGVMGQRGGGEEGGGSMRGKGSVSLSLSLFSETHTHTHLPSSPVLGARARVTRSHTLTQVHRILRLSERLRDRQGQERERRREREQQLVALTHSPGFQGGHGHPTHMCGSSQGFTVSVQHPSKVISPVQDRGCAFYYSRFCGFFHLSVVIPAFLTLCW